MGQNNHSGHWGINSPPQKHHPSLFCQAPLKSTNCQSPSPFLGNLPLYIGFSRPPLKVGSFSEPQKYSSFSSLIPSYLLKVTKFLGKISQFEFLVMTEKNIFAYKSQILIYFYVKTATPA